jgi:hypothetical protein
MRAGVRRKSYTSPVGGVDPAVLRTLFEFLYYGPAQFGGCAFSFFVLFFLFLFYFTLVSLYKFENCSDFKF